MEMLVEVVTVQAVQALVEAVRVPVVAVKHLFRS
jgi:hypothetical protein